MMRVPGWAWLFWAAVATHAEPVYKKLGDTVILKPDATSGTGTITEILWKHGPDLAAQLDGGEIDIYTHFEGRSSVNSSSGEMTITALTREDSGVYTVELNSGPPSATKLIVIAPVPTPTVMLSCDNDMTSCVLTCDGNTTDAEPVTYRWIPDHPEASRERRITKEDSGDQPEFSCEMENPVSQMRSQTIANPFTRDREDPAVEGLKISAGLTVFISLLVSVLVLGLIHRWKAGMWFYQKDSMPWEADFWRKNESPPRDAAESNGMAASQEQTQSDEESPMTK
ncbi:uncharacterized protein V6R79_008125 [Siganus canaliculatus]